MRAGTLPSIGSAPFSVRRSAVVAAIVATSLLAGCATRTTQAPVSDMSQGGGTGASVSTSSGTYTVRSGDTLYKISQAQGVSVAQLISLNNITDPTQLRVGQVLRLGSGAPAAPDSSPATTATPSPVTPPKTAEPTSVARASDASLINWGWPANGKIIQSFNAGTKGIDIEGKEGDPVIAAAEGKVMYAGNGVRGLGNLILLGHSNGFITAYAHNQSLLVKTGQEVKKGEKIAAIGQTDTTSPRLHFEIRRRGTPVNPLSYLPGR